MRRLAALVCALAVGVVGCTAPQNAVGTSSAPETAVSSTPSSTVSTTAAAMSSATSNPSLSTSQSSSSTASAPQARSSVDLAACGDCTILATAPDVRADLTGALVSRGNRALLIAVDTSGSARAVVNIPYGATFPPPADGVLVCGAARCVVSAMTTEGRAVLSAFELTDAGWVDRSAAGGFRSATPRGLPVLLDGGAAAAIQLSDGSATVWTVLAWNGTRYTSAGCMPDAETPDLAAIDPARCLS